MLSRTARSAPYVVCRSGCMQRWAHGVRTALIYAALRVPMKPPRLSRPAGQRVFSDATTAGQGWTPAVLTSSSLMPRRARSSFRFLGAG